MLSCLSVGIGGFIGSVCRYLISILFPLQSVPFPLCTLLINFTSAFLIGLFTGISLEICPIPPNIQLLLQTGFCGGFSTLSALSLETFQLFQNGQWLIGSCYAIGSIILSIVGVILARLLIVMITQKY